MAIKMRYHGRVLTAENWRRQYEKRYPIVGPYTKCRLWKRRIEEDIVYWNGSMKLLDWRSEKVMSLTLVQKMAPDLAWPTGILPLHCRQCGLVTHEPKRTYERLLRAAYCIGFSACRLQCSIVSWFLYRPGLGATSQCPSM